MKWLKDKHSASLTQMQQKVKSYIVAKDVEEEEVADMGGLFGDDDDY